MWCFRFGGFRFRVWERRPRCSDFCDNIRPLSSRDFYSSGVYVTQIVVSRSSEWVGCSFGEGFVKVRLRTKGDNWYQGVGCRLRFLSVQI